MNNLKKKQPLPIHTVCHTTNSYNFNRKNTGTKNFLIKLYRLPIPIQKKSYYKTSSKKEEKTTDKMSLTNLIIEMVYTL